jgi:hypothetical protein
MSSKRKTPARNRALTARSSLSVFTGSVLPLQKVALVAAPPAEERAIVAPEPVKSATPRASEALPSISSDERRRMIEGLAYRRAERAGFRTDPIHDWLSAEREVDAALQRLAS